MLEKVTFAKEDLETAVYRLGTLRGLLGMLRYSGQTPSDINGEDLEGAILSIDYIIGDVEDNIRDVIVKMNGWQKEELRKGA